MNSAPTLIGLSGKAGSGKSKAASYLADQHDYQEFAFAGALRAVVMSAFQFRDMQMLFSKEVIDSRFGKSPRWCLQYFGSAFREVWPEIWVENLRKAVLDFWDHYGRHPVVVSDVRFRKQRLLSAWGAVMVRLERDAVNRQEAGGGGIPGHVSETDLDGWKSWHHVIDNNGTLGNLYHRLDLIVAGKADKEPS
jgi:hypothetical protein